MQCPKCGKEIPNDSIFCEFCGARMKKSRKALWITLSVILVSISAIVAFTIIKEQQEHQAANAWEKEQAAQKQQELEQQLEAEHLAKEEAERQAELARQEAARKAEAERQAEIARQEAARKAEAERQAEIARQREARRQELLSKGYVDLGLPSGTLWKNSNEGGDNALYTYSDALRRFGNKLPTKQQLEELKNKCTWTWTGSGYKVTGPSGDHILLPAAGYRDCLGYVYHVGRYSTYGSYWSSTPSVSDFAWYLYFTSSEVVMYDLNRCDGRSVRLVQ